MSNVAASPAVPQAPRPNLAELHREAKRLEALLRLVEHRRRARRVQPLKRGAR